MTMRMAMVALAMAITSPVSAQATADTGTKAPPKQERKICKQMEQTGSRMGGGKRVCHTATEWQQLEADSFARNVNGAGMMRGSGQN